MKIDDINIEIIKHLRDGRKSFKILAKKLSISENTVRSRVNKLIDEGILEITGLVDPEAIAGHRVVFIGVKLSTLNLVEKGKEFSKLNATDALYTARQRSRSNRENTRAPKGCAPNLNL